MTRHAPYQPERIRGFDGVRALAALTVIAVHAGAFMGLGSRAAALVQPVTLFFVLSGFLISRNLLVEQHVTGRVQVIRFWWHRALRLLPGYFTVLAATAALAWLGAISPITGRHLALAAGYLANFVDRAHYTHPLAATWSLAVEEHFYLVWPLVLLAVPRGRLRRLVVGLLACLTACLVVRALLTMHPHLLAGFFWNRFTVPAADALVVGCILAVVAARRHPLLPTRSLTPARLWLAPVAVASYLAPLWLPAAPAWGWATTGYYLQLVGMAVGLWLVVTNQRSWPVRMLEVAPLRLLGTISYGVYLWQGVVLGTGPGDQRHAWQQLPQSLILIVAMATASWLLVERPVQRWGRPRVIQRGAQRGVRLGAELTTRR